MKKYVRILPLMCLFIVLIVNLETPFALAAKKSIASCNITVADAEYTGKEVKPKVTVKDGKTTLKEGTHYSLAYSNNVNPGSGTVKISGKGTYNGSVKKSFKIRKQVSQLTITVQSAVYTGKELKPPITVKDGKSTLKEGIDYTLAYSDNVTVGTGKVTVKGKGNYTGNAEKTFPIRKHVSKLNVSVKNASYTGKAVTPSVTVKDGNSVLLEGKDYTLAYSNNVNLGDGSVTIKGKGTYTGSTSRTFKIRKNISATSVSVKDVTYNGKAQTPTVTVKDGKTTIKSGSAYTLSWSNNKSVGTGKVTISGTGNYSGSVTKTFTIKARNLSSCTITLKDETCFYMGSPVTPKVTVQYGETTLKNKTDYMVTYEDNAKRGIGKAVVAGKGNFTGTVKKEFVVFATTAKALKFVQDSRWKDGITWGYYQNPKISSYGAIGCCAYTADFVKYCYGLNNPTQGNNKVTVTEYTDVSEIQRGDIIRCNPQHWIVILDRRGNLLLTAEGNWGSKVVIGDRYIDGDKIMMPGSGTTKTFAYGYHYKTK